MPVLTTQQRNTLESAIKLARKLAEAGARNTLHTLAVDNTEPFAHLIPDQRILRNRLRNKARLLGDELPSTGHQQIDHLAYELAYENWHKMLFAKFLESNGLLMHPSGVAVTMEECEELAKEEGYTDKWDAAATYASKMLPIIFRPEDPLMQLSFASNDRIRLEEILDGIDNYIFTADDALGWVYQYWQSDAKKAIEIEEKNGTKIDGERLPAKTQLFTEHYMVQFLIDNTLGAWWVSRHPNESAPVKFKYLLFLSDGTPAAGKFEGWPNSTKEITTLDPCMGSGHFVSSLFPLFAKLRMYEEGLTEEEASEKVINENLHGLELDARCTQIAAFNLALTAWKFCGHYTPLPEMNLACSGIAPKGKKEDWIKLVNKESNAEKKQRLENGIEHLYNLFQQAPEIGSLLDPLAVIKDMYTASFEEIQPVLIQALKNEVDKDQIELGVMAAGIAKAGQLLAKKYTLQITNVPYLGRARQVENGSLSTYCNNYYPDAKADLATVFLDRMLKGVNYGGTACSVIPQNWLFLTTYKKYRERLLKTKTWNIVARLGAKAFQTPMWDFNVMLIGITNVSPSDKDCFTGLDVGEESNSTTKDSGLLSADLKYLNQLLQLKNPDVRIILEGNDNLGLLEKYANCYAGILNGDSPRFQRNIWEIPKRSDLWALQQTTVDVNKPFGGLSLLIYYDSENGHLREEAWIRKEKLHDSDQRGNKAWGKWGIGISQMNSLPVSLYTGAKFDSNIAIICPKDQSHILPIWLYCQSIIYTAEVRKIDQKINVTNATLVKIPFDLEFWQKEAKEKYPKGLPNPYSNDATQWLFHGHPIKADNPLQVAVGRLLGYRWPAENDIEIELAPNARELIKQVNTFDSLTDDDGILCIPPVNGELAASAKLRSYLQAVYGSTWNNNTIGQLLTKEGTNKSNLEEWLREDFFEQHYKLFQNRPFIWHIWDGRRDGFSVLVNYHKLNKENLQRLIFTYLGDWIRQCEAKKKDGESGAEGLLSAATKLKAKLEAILTGEAPYDIFVRWKPLDKHPIGWEPDLNDGVRLNIRPFIIAEILRKKPNINWGVDRGKNPSGSHWGDVRDNNKYLSLDEKRKAKESKY